MDWSSFCRSRPVLPSNSSLRNFFAVSKSPIDSASFITRYSIVLGLFVPSPPYARNSRSCSSAYILAKLRRFRACRLADWFALDGGVHQPHLLSTPNTPVLVTCTFACCNVGHLFSKSIRSSPNPSPVMPSHPR